MSITNTVKTVLLPTIQLVDKDYRNGMSVKPSKEHAGAGIPLPPVSAAPTKILPADVHSPDNHVPRDSRLIRLTGNHPFNCEAPLTDLFEAELFYVRNHGAVPRVPDERVRHWKVRIEGMVENPITLTVEQLMTTLPQFTMPITLVCAGNRRKEQNQVRKGSGFNWGPAGLSTSLFTGPLLRDVLALAKPFRQARYVWMEGADKLPNGHYGTSVLLRHAMESENGMMLAYKMNGELLRPDHGRPIRAVIPGVIGGRSVKWLTKLVVATEPSNNYYHIYDNRVLPTVVTPEMAINNKNWWTDERYAIYDLNVNSAIVRPANDEEVSLPKDMNGRYRVTGYAYSGGGRRITRVEISLDKGRSWKLGDITYPEDRYRVLANGDLNLYGGRLDMKGWDKCFCWCFWSMELTLHELHLANDIVVRAMDEAMNVQPRDLYWNVMGMMNNCWFRVVIHKDVTGKLKFEHPTLPALMPGGWMARIKQAGGDLQDGNWGEHLIKNSNNGSQVQVVMVNPNVTKEFTMEEIEKHNKHGDAWFIVHGQVYDGSKFLKEHPGGAESIIMASGADASDDFMAIHSETAKAMLVGYHIGRVRVNVLPGSKGVPTVSLSQRRPTFLDPKMWQKSRLVRKKSINHDTRLLEFGLEHSEQFLGLPIGKHLFLRVKDGNSKYVVRAYTPISNPSEKGIVGLVVKMYLPSTEYPTGGKMTTVLESLNDGDTVHMKGPLGGFEYLGRGRVRFRGLERKVEKLAMVCGGSGITPIYQILRAVVQDKADGTACIVVNGNRFKEDILFREDLEKWQTRENVKIWNTLTCPPTDGSWKQGIGRINSTCLKEQFGDRNGAKTMILVCGPLGMCDAVKQWCDQDGWCPENDLVVF